MRDLVETIFVKQMKITTHAVKIATMYYVETTFAMKTTNLWEAVLLIAQYLLAETVFANLAKMCECAQLTAQTIFVHPMECAIPSSSPRAVIVQFPVIAMVCANGTSLALAVPIANRPCSLSK